jgi:hypothetical protein
MIPDVEKFIRMRAAHSYSYSHSLEGIFLFNLPLALILAFVYHILVQDSFITHLPLFFRKRLAFIQHFNFVPYFRRHYWVVIISILLGAASHILWDSFTHLHGKGVQQFPILLEHLHQERGIWIRIYHLLDIISSVAGVGYIGYTLLKLPVTDVRPKPLIAIIRYWILVGVLACGIVVIRVLNGLPSSIWDLAIISVAAGLLSVFVTSLLIKLKL